MIDKPPRKPALRIAIWIVAALAVGLVAGYLLKDQIDSFKLPGDDGDTPIIVRDGSIIITSKGEDLTGFAKPHANVIIHPKTNSKLGKLKVNGQLKGSPCANTKECGVEFMWSTGTPGQPGYQEYTVVVGSNSGDGKNAGIVSSIPFADYTSSQATDSATGMTAYTYTWSPTGQLAFREAKLHKLPLKAGMPRPTPQVICSNPGCRIEFEYK